MVPFFEFHSIKIIPGTIEFHVFGILVGTGVLMGSWLAQKRAEQVGLNTRVVADLALWIVLVSFFFAHQVSLFAYFPERVFGDACTFASDCLIAGEQFECRSSGRCNNGSWVEVLRIWDGISSYGGFLGAFIAIASYFRFRTIKVIPGVIELVGGKGRPLLRYLDVMTQGFAVGWFFGRMGCFTAHDHIGKASEFFLAVNFPDDFRSGVPNIADVGAVGFTPRFDLGFLEMLYTIPLIAFFYLWANKRPNLRPGFYCAVMVMSYAPYRFFLDSLRATDISGADKRYFASLIEPGLTPGQIGSVLILFLGMWLWWLGGRAAENEAYKSYTGADDAGQESEAGA